MLKIGDKMLSEKDREKLIYKITELCQLNQVDEQIIDFDAQIDMMLSYSENYDNLKEIYGLKDDQDMKEQIIERKIKEKPTLKAELYLNQNNLLIVGKKHCGKTAFAFNWLMMCKYLGKRKLFVYQFSEPEALKALPFEVINLLNMKQLSQIRDGAVLIDEAHIVFNVMEKAVNRRLRNLLSISAKTNTSFIFVCHNSYFLNKSLFTFFDTRIIKEVNEGHWELERPFMKKLYQDVEVSGVENFFIDSEYTRGSEMFKKPVWFDDLLGRAFANVKEVDFFPEIPTKIVKSRTNQINAVKCGEVRKKPNDSKKPTNLGEDKHENE